MQHMDACKEKWFCKFFLNFLFLFKCDCYKSPHPASGQNEWLKETAFFR
jgi:hypothetical protein